MLTRLDDKTTEGRYITIRNYGHLDGKKTNTYWVWAKGEEMPLGSIAWFSRWRKYAFTAASDQVTLEEICMGDLSQFIVEETKAHMAAVKQAKKQLP